MNENIMRATGGLEGRAREEVAEEEGRVSERVGEGKGDIRLNVGV